MQVQQPAAEQALFHPTFEVSFMDTASYLGRSHEIGNNIALIYQKRMRIATEGFGQRVNGAISAAMGAATDAAAGPKDANAEAKPPGQFDPWFFQRYAVDAMQRSILF
jgi:hypothetical protein